MKRFLFSALALFLFGLAASGCEPMPGSWVVRQPSVSTSTISETTPAVVLSDDVHVLLPSTLTMQIVPVEGSLLQPRITVTDTTGETAVELASVVAPAAGKPALLQTLFLDAGIQYTVTVTGENGSVGGFTDLEFSNSALEEEAVGEESNNTPTTAQSILASFLPSLNGSERGAVAGTLFGYSDMDAYSFSLKAGDVIDLAMEETEQISLPVMPGSLSEAQREAPAQFNSAEAASSAIAPLRFEMRLLTADGSPLPATPILAPTRIVDATQRYQIPADGKYIVAVQQTDVTSTFQLPYQLLVIRGGEMELEQNDRAETAQLLKIGHPIFGYVGYGMPNPFANSGLPGVAEAFPFRFSISTTGAFYHSGLPTGIAYLETEQLSMTDPHQFYLQKNDKVYTAEDVSLTSHTIGNLHILVITGEFDLLGDETERIVFKREVRWYQSLDYAQVHTQLTNTTLHALDGFQLVDRFNADPGGHVQTENDRVLNDDLLVSSTSSAAFGVGSPDETVVLAFATTADPEDAYTDDVMIVSDLLPALNADETTQEEYYLVFGPNAELLEPQYQSAVAAGLSLEDYYQVPLKKGLTYNIRAHMPTMLSTAGGTPLTIEVYNAQGVKVAEQNSNDAGWGEGLFFSPAADDGYTIHVFLPESAANMGLDYVFSVDEVLLTTYLPILYTTDR